MDDNEDAREAMDEDEREEEGGEERADLGKAFLDREAEEDSAEDEEAEGAGGEGGDDDDDDDDDEADEQNNRYEADGFLVLDDDKEREEEAAKKAKGRNEERFIPLDQEDLELIQSEKKKKPLKRLKKKGEVVVAEVETAKKRKKKRRAVGGDVAEPRDAGDEEGPAGDDDDDDDVDRDADAGDELEDDDDRGDNVDEGDDDDDEGEGEGKRGPEGDVEDYDDGFIVGKRSRHALQERRHRLPVVSSRVTDQQLMEWQSIFGGDEKLAESFMPDEDFVPEDEREEGDRALTGQTPSAGGSQASQDAADSGSTMKQLTKLFDPSMLEKRFLTNRDIQVRDQDVPERFQLRYPKRPPPEGEGVELKMEASWILKQCFAEKRAMSDDEQLDVTAKIFFVLHFLRNDLLEVPFIVQYRSDYVTPLTEDDCWEIYDMDERWYRLSQKKKQLLALFGDKSEMVALGADEKYLDNIAAAETEEDLQDLLDYFHFHFPKKRAAGPAAAGASAKREPAARAAGEAVDVFFEQFIGHARKFGLTAAQFGENLFNNQLVHVPVDEPLAPKEFAASCMTEKMSDVDRFLASCRSVLARELANDPFVRQSLRSVYTDRATVSTHPTEKGVEEIDYWHSFRNVKRLDQEPLADFRDSDKFALIMEAEKGGFVTVSIDVDEHIEEMAELYLSKMYDSVATEWNKQRKLVLQEALQRYLYPRMRKEVRQRLEEWAFQSVCRKASRELFSRIFSAPYQPPKAIIYEEEMPYQGPRGRNVMTVCVPDDRKESPFAVVVNRSGEVLEWAKISFFERERNMGKGPHHQQQQNALFGAEADNRRQQLQKEDTEKVRRLILDYRPGIIGIAASPGSAHALQIRDLLSERGAFLDALRNELVSTPPRVFPKVAWVDGRAAQVFRNTSVSATEYPDYPVPLRQAISVARSMVDPLAEYSRLWDDKQSIAFLGLHPFQSVVPRKQLLEWLERAFVRATSSVGVDINNVVRYPHLASTLQFVPGLGPRKAKYLIESIFKSRRNVERRTGDLKRLLTAGADSELEIVYTNAVAYLRITPEHFAHPESTIGPLDNTRIHPNDYRFAYKIAADAMEDQGDAEPRSEKGRRGNNADDPEAEKNSLVRRAMEEHDEIVRVEVDGLAAVWKTNYGEEKLLALQALKEEMLSPFKDRRAEFREVSNREAFFIVTGESEETLPYGKIVRCVIRAVRRHAVLVSFDELNGFIRREDVTDSTTDPVESICTPGLPLICRIKGIDFDRWEVQLTCKTSDLQDYGRFEPHDALIRDHKYLLWTEAEQERLRLEKEKLEKQEQADRSRRRRTTQAMRVVDHPLFQNLNQVQVAEALRDAPCGEAIFRPSSKGNDFITLSYKGLGTEIIHVPVAEVDKPNEAALGRQLLIQGVSEVFEDLDEILARYVSPMAAHMLVLQNFRHFNPRTREEILDDLRARKRSDPNTIHYFVGTDDNNPGWFTLYYIVVGDKVIEEPISIRPSGYRYRHRTFPSLTELFEWFKRHFMDKERAPPRGGDSHQSSRSASSSSRSHQGHQSGSGSSRDHHRSDSHRSDSHRSDHRGGGDRDYRGGGGGGGGGGGRDRDDRRRRY